MMPAGGMGMHDPVLLLPRLPVHPGPSHAVSHSFTTLSDVACTVSSWEDWGRAGSLGERRSVAVSRLKACLVSDDTDLDLSELGLSTLPDYLPESLARLDVSYNSLTSLPARLPSLLICLVAGFNVLEDLPDRLPPSLLFLSVDNNCLSMLPKALPAGLLGLDADNNLLTHLPNALPATLVTLRAGQNNLIILPSSLPHSLEGLDLSDNLLAEFPFVIMDLRGCVVHVSRNDFSQEVLQQLAFVTAVPGYDGPCIVNAGGETGMTGVDSPRTVEEVVSVWYPVEVQVAAGAAWRALNDEPGADAFFAFLDELGQTVCAESAYLFCHVGPWLSLLASTPVLRAVTYAIAQEATASCDDRVVLTLNHMQQARMVHDVEMGRYDANYAQLIACARVMFRHECLEQIAREKITMMTRTPWMRAERIDQVEIYLALQVKLGESLQLDLMGQEMRYFGISRLTAEQLALSERAVKEEENTHFPQWLSGWPPWQRLVERQNPAGWAAAQNRLRHLMDAPLQQLISAELQPLALERDDDAIRIVGRRIADRITENVYMSLLSATLEMRRCAALLWPVWKLPAIAAATPNQFPHT